MLADVLGLPGKQLSVPKRRQEAVDRVLDLLIQPRFEALFAAGITGVLEMVIEAGCARGRGSSPRFPSL